ncbi:MAG: AMP-binding protein [Alphaproteobacteria bacterium]|nr:AMP-binding protein [Alphaproteobacteria bacterium]
MILPGGVPSAHTDLFARDNLPPRESWPRFDYSALPILASYPNRINCAVELLDRMVASGHGSRPVLHMGETTWTYRQLLALTNRIARVLVEDLGLVPGNRVLLRAPNHPMLVACWLAVLRAGGICVTTMALLRARELAYTIEKAQVSHALCDASVLDALEEARAPTPVLKHVLTFSPLATRHPSATLDRAIAGKPESFTPVDTAADDMALIAFTSGTTGAAKATMHFHRDVMAITDCFPRSFRMAEPDDVFTGTPPLAFTFGLGGLTCFPMRFGASTRYLEEPSPEAMLEAIERYRITGLYTAPTAYRVMCDLAAKYDLRSLRKCVSAGETLPKATWEAFHERTGVRIADGLGSTEMLHIFVSAAPADMRAGLTGRAIPGYEARIVDDAGNTLPPGTPGLLAVRGPTGCRYLADPERQRTYVRDGWNYPGDMYEMNEDGYFRYVARADDMIISSGYNLSGPEIEAVLLDHPKVKECAVVASPDPERTNVAKAFIVLRDAAERNEATVKELQDFVKGEIAPYKYPRAIEFVEALPKTETGKLQRFRLRALELERAKARGR